MKRILLENNSCVSRSVSTMSVRNLCGMFDILKFRRNTP